MACHEVRSSDQICRTDRLVAETEVRTSETARFLGVVREVSLAIFVGVVADDLDRVLVGTYSTVGTKTEELSLEHTLAAYADLREKRE